MDGVRSIAAATDFSADAGRAARRAALLADEHGVPLELLHVVSAPELERLRNAFRGRAEVAERITADAQRALEAAAAELSSPTRQVRTRLAVGDVRGELVAASGDGVVLVVGARGDSGLADVLFGSTAERVVREAAGPVLVVRAEPRGAYENVLVGVDLESGCGALLREVGRLVPQARLTALHAYRVPFEGALRRAGVRDDEVERHRGATLKAALDGIAALAAEAPGIAPRVTAASERGDPARLLVDYGSRIRADVIAVARRGRRALAAFVLGSVARRVVADADRDVLVLPGPPAG
jgi:nucleotide-binding universal stress UspA family protein